MKIFILSPNCDVLFNAEQILQLKQAGELFLQQESVALEDVEGLFTGDEPRILAIDPDFFNWKFPSELLRKIPHLKGIILQTTSFSWIDVGVARELGVPVVNLRHFSTVAVAEWVCLMVLDLARKLPLVIQNNWQLDYAAQQGIELRGKKAGVIGLGHIGTCVAENLSGLGMDVCYWSRASRDDRFTLTELANLISTSDVVVLCLAKNQETSGLLDEKLLLTMKKSAIFVSVAHDIYSHELLLSMVKENKLLGYGYETSSDVMAQQGNVWAGPELGWCTRESFEKNAQKWLEAIVAASQGSFPNRVN